MHGFHDRLGPATTDTAQPSGAEHEIISLVSDEENGSTPTTPTGPTRDSIQVTSPRNSPTPDHEQSISEAAVNRRTTNQQTPGDANWYRHVAYKRISPLCPTVIEIEDQWTEISCNVCGANASHRDGEFKFYGGWLGLYNHIRQAHKSLIQNPVEDANNLMKRRQISDEDAALMMEQREPLT